MRRALPVLRPLRQSPLHRTLSTTAPQQTSWTPGPAPPRLPKEEQEIFEQLQRQSTGAFSAPKETASTTTTKPSQQQQQRQPPRVNQSPHSAPTAAEEGGAQAQAAAERLEEQVRAKVKAKGDGEELHPNVRRGAPPEFEGDRNPKTGETGGPKNDPLRWGGQGDWSYNGRVTDF